MAVKMRIENFVLHIVTLCRKRSFSNPDLKTMCLCGLNGSFIKLLFFFVFINLSSVSYSQEGDNVIVPNSQVKPVYRVWAEIINGDTVPSMRLPDVWIYADYSYKTRKQYEAWTRTKYNVKKVYPYAILAAAKLKEYDRILQKMPDEKTKKAYLKVIDKELRAEFEEPLKDLSVSQGRILLKLIDRESGKTSYEVVKEMRGNFQAFMWQSIARIFGNNMKSEYDPQGEDAMIERAIKLIEAGQF